MFDTHTHLNFKRFKKNVQEVIGTAKAAGVTHMVIPGTDVKSSKKAIELAELNDGVYAAVGIHPHHVVDEDILVLNEIDALASHEKVVAIGEIGLDRHVYEDTKYEDYHVDEDFISRQRDFFVKQLELAKKHDLSIIVHNREAKQDLLTLLEEQWDDHYKGRMVFHCCEPDEDLIQFARERDIFIGVDGDVTWDSPFAEQKREFIKKILKNDFEKLVLETDSPFLLPEPLRAEKKYPNTSANLPLIGEYLANLVGEAPETVYSTTKKNAMRLFGLSE